MENMRKSIIVLSLLGLLTACVTINIYFPAAAAQEVADKIIDDVWQLKEGEGNQEGQAETTEPKGDTQDNTQEAQ